MPSKQLRVSCRLPLLFCWHSLIAQPKFVSSAHSLESYLYTVVLAYNPVDLFRYGIGLQSGRFGQFGNTISQLGNWQRPLNL